MGLRSKRDLALAFSDGLSSASSETAESTWYLRQNSASCRELMKALLQTVTLWAENELEMLTCCRRKKLYTFSFKDAVFTLC